MVTQPMPSTKTCSMPECGRIMESYTTTTTLRVEPTTVYFCTVCDRRQCKKCKASEQDTGRQTCSNCGADFRDKP